MKQTTQLLKESLSPLYDAREVKAIIRLLLEEVCGLTYTQIVMAADNRLPEEQRQILAGFAARLANGEPVQQVLGYTWFKGRKFELSTDVLIPRPETEELVDIVVESFEKRSVDKSVDSLVTNSVLNSPSGVDNSVASVQKCPSADVDNRMDKEMDNCLDNAQNPPAMAVDNTMDNPVYNLVDIGTGSGCIALSLAADIHHSFITAVDLSTEALKVAETNAKSLNISNIRFVQADILKEENSDFSTELSTVRYDAIVSNPPYICQQEAVDMEPNVLEHEPHLALFVPDEDPLLFYRVIAKYGKRHLKPGGGLYFEINAAYGKETCELLYQLGYQQVQLIQDFTGRDRFVTAKFNPSSEFAYMEYSGITL